MNTLSDKEQKKLLKQIRKGLKQGECKRARKSLQRLRLAFRVLTENAHGHHTPHMVCIPKETWENVMELVGD